MDPVKEFQDLVQLAADKLKAQGLDSLKGDDWWQLSEAEQQVFGLDLSEMSLLITVYDAYEGVIGVSHNDFHANADLCARLRVALPWLSKYSGSEQEFRKFADLFGVAQDKAHCIYQKIALWQYRQGLLTFQVPT